MKIWSAPSTSRWNCMRSNKGGPFGAVIVRNGAIVAGLQQGHLDRRCDGPRRSRRHPRRLCEVRHFPSVGLRDLCELRTVPDVPRRHLLGEISRAEAAAIGFDDELICCERLLAAA